MLSLYQGAPAPSNCSFFLLSPSLPHPNSLHCVFFISRFSAQRSPEEQPPTAQDGWWQKTLRALKTLLLFSIILGLSLLLWGYVFQGCGPCKQDPRSPHSPLSIHPSILPRPTIHPDPWGPWVPSLVPRESLSCPSVRPFPPHQGLCPFPQPDTSLLSPLGGVLIASSFAALSFSPQPLARRLCVRTSWISTWPLGTPAWPPALISLALPVETSTGLAVLFRLSQRRTGAELEESWVRESGWKVLVLDVPWSLEWSRLSLPSLCGWGTASLCRAPLAPRELLGLPLHPHAFHGRSCLSSISSGPSPPHFFTWSLPPHLSHASADICVISLKISVSTLRPMSSHTGVSSPPTAL